VVIQLPGAQQNGRFSPDGRWIAYDSNDSGRLEVYLQQFPGPGNRLQVSTNGGSIPQWRKDGLELFYIGADERLMATPLARGDSGIAAGRPAALFSVPRNSSFAVSPDGQRFLVHTTTEDPAPITVLLNSAALLKQ
jgi:eukaryotic-like serine/threonine-protein kinase